MSRPPAPHEPQIAALERRLERERRTRLAAERIAEKGLRELYDRQQQLGLLEAVADAANQSSTVAEALQYGVRTVCEFSDWEIGHAYLLDEGGRSMRPTAIWHGVGEGRFRDFYGATENTGFEAGQGLPGRVLASGAPAWIPDIAADPGFPRAEAALRDGLRSAVAFPILLGTEVTAVLEFFAAHTCACWRRSAPSWAASPSASEPGTASSTTPSTTPSPGCPTGPSSPTGSPMPWPAPPATRGAPSPSSSPTWTGSSSSTTASATRSGTPSSPRSPGGGASRCAPGTRWPGSAATSSRSCWTGSRTSTTPCAPRRA